MKDTLRVLVSFGCNLSCSYCCNNIPEIREKIKEVKLDDIDFSPYRVVCISGGEPLLFPEKIRVLCHIIPINTLKVLYTNGIFLTKEMGSRLWGFGIDAINVGLHIESTFDPIIRKATEAWKRSLRFQVEDKYEYLKDLYPDIGFRFWKMNDCFRNNEDIVVLKG